MFTLSKIYQGSMRSCRVTPVSMRWPGVYYSLSSGDCDGDKKGGKDTSKGDDDDPCKPCDPCNPCEPCDPCPVCPCPSDYNPSTPTMYDCRKYGHCLPSNNVMPCFEPLPNMPTGIFRCTAGEVLGHGAAKCSFYQNPEYFAYQHMTFYDMHLILRCYRMPSPRTGRKP